MEINRCVCGGDVAGEGGAGGDCIIFVVWKPPDGSILLWKMCSVLAIHPRARLSTGEGMENKVVDVFQNILTFHIPLIYHPQRTSVAW
jgi:hypothetical protein